MTSILNPAMYLCGIWLFWLVIADCSC